MYSDHELFIRPDPTCANFSDALDQIESSLMTNNRYIVFQCRTTDDCGGWGDRLAGLAGAAMLAVTTGRRLRIHWPGLEAVVRSNTFYDWTFDYEALGISHVDMAWVNLNAVHTYSPVGFTNSPVGGEKQDVAFLNTHNHDTYWKNGALLDEVESRGPRVIFFHGNRGLSHEVLARFEHNHGEFGREFTNGGISATSNTMGCYRCIWRTLLAPSRQAFDITLSLTSNQTTNETTLGEILHKLNDPAVCSIGYAFRIDDSATSAPLPLNLHGCLMGLVRTMCTASQRKYFMFSTNSLVASLEVSRMLTGTLFDEVFATSEHALERHVNVKEFSEQYGRDMVESIVNRATQLAIADWFMMTAVDVLVVSVSSGFSSSAALYSQGHQVLVSNTECDMMHPDALVAGRFF